VGLPFIKGVIHGLIMHDDIHIIKEGQKPKLNKISNRKECLTPSKALAMPILIRMPLSLFS